MTSFSSLLTCFLLTFKYLGTNCQVSSTTWDDFNATDTPTSVPTGPSSEPTTNPSIMPTYNPSTIPTATLYPTGQPFLNDGRHPTAEVMSTISRDETGGSDDHGGPCDKDGNDCSTYIPTTIPSLSPTNIPSIEPTQMPTPPTLLPTSAPNSVIIVQQSETSSDRGWNDPIVIAVGLLGFLVLILTLMVTVFACMAYTKSKENMKITERLKAQFMADNSHSRDNEYQQGKKRAEKFQTDYRNVQSTDAVLDVHYNEEAEAEAGAIAAPGSAKKSDVLELEEDEENIIIEMGKDGKYKTRHKETAPSMAGESEAPDINDNNHLRPSVASSHTPGYVSTEEVISNVQNEGPDDNDKPPLRLISSSASDDQGFAAGLNNVAAADNAIEDDIIAHMATAGDGGNDDEKDSEEQIDLGRINGGGSIQLQYG